MQQRFGKYLHQHRLRREIIATATTNSIVNRMGPTFARRVQEDTGADAAHHRPRLRDRARGRTTCATRGPTSKRSTPRSRRRLQYEMMYETTRLLRFCTYWLHPSPVGQARHRAPGVAPAARHRRARRRACRDVLSGADLDVLREPPRAAIVAANVPEALAQAHGEPRGAALRPGPRRDRRADASCRSTHGRARVLRRRRRAVARLDPRADRSARRRRPLAGSRAHARCATTSTTCSARSACR